MRSVRPKTFHVSVQPLDGPRLTGRVPAAQLLDLRLLSDVGLITLTLLRTSSTVRACLARPAPWPWPNDGGPWSSPNPLRLNRPLKPWTVEQHRSFGCAQYESCLDLAIRRGWASWSCSTCPMRRTP